MNNFTLLILLVAVIRSSAIAAEASWTPSLPEFTEPTYGRVIKVSVIEPIQPAINQASKEGGGKVILAPGIFPLSAPLIPRSNVTLAGSGDGTSITTLQNTLGTNMQLMIDGRNGGIENFVLKKLKVDGMIDRIDRNWPQTERRELGLGVFITDKPHALNRNILLDQVEITRCSMGFHCKGTTDLTVKDCNFHDNGGCLLFYHNCYLRRVSRALLASSHFDDSTSGNGINISYSDNITVQGSLANNNRFRGMRVAESTRIAFLDNTTANNQDVGILVNSEKDGVHDFRVLGNTSTGNRIGIETTENSSGGEVSNNNVSGNKVQTVIKSRGSVENH